MRGRKTDDAIEIINMSFYEGKPTRIAKLEEARASAGVARQIHALRTAAGLSQADLAALVGTSRSVISRLENDDYEGLSVAMLRHIASAVGMAVEIRFVPAGRKKNGTG